MQKNAGKKEDAGNVFMLGVVSFFTDVSSEMIFPLLPVFLTTVLGAGKEALGIIEGIADSISSFVEIFSGYFSDRSGNRKKWVLAGYSISAVVKAGIVVASAWWQVLFLRALERMGKGIRTSPRDAIIASSASEKTRGKAFGLHRTMDTLGAIVGPVLAYFVLIAYGQSAEGYRTVFLFALIPAFIAVAAIVFLVREPKKTVPVKKKTPFWQALKELPLKYKTFLKVSLLFSLSYFSFAFFIVRANELGVSAENILLLYIIYNVVYAASSLPTGMLSDRIGRKPVIAGAFALYGLICVGFALASSFEHLAVLFAVYGVFVTADESVNKAYIADMAGEEQRGMALGAYNTAIGIAYLPASIAVGTLWTTVGASTAFGASAAVAIASATAFYVYCR